MSQEANSAQAQSSTPQKINNSNSENAAHEALRRLKARKEQRQTRIWLKPSESVTLWFDATKQVETQYPNKYSEDENAMRDMVDFTIKTKEGSEKILPLTPTRAELVNEILVEKGGCAWIKVTRNGTSNTDTRYNFIPV